MYEIYQKIRSVLPVETDLSENTIKYLEATCQKLHNREKTGCLIFDEIYTAKRCEFSRSNGQIYGMSNEQPTKTPLSVMFKSIASKYEDKVAEGVAQRCSVKKEFLEILENSQKNTCARVSLFFF